MTQKRLFLTSLVTFLFILMIPFSSFGKALAANEQEVIFDPQSNSSESVYVLLSKLSDEQVRQMLITELKKDTETENDSHSLTNNLKGPGAPLSRLLNLINSESAQSEHQLKELLHGIPKILPDLYKVFISL